MRKIIVFVLVFSWLFSSVQLFGLEVDEFEEQQYLQYYQIFGKTTEAQLPILDQIIAIKPSSKWAGRAMLEKARIFILKKDFENAETMVLAVINNYGSLRDPYGIIQKPRGWVRGEESYKLEEISKKYSVTLENSARLLLAEIYIKIGKKDKAIIQLKALADDKASLSGIRSELKSEEEVKLMKDNWWPQQKALTVLMGVYEDKGDYKAAADISEEVLQYGNYRDVNIGEKKLIDYRIKLKEFKKAQALIEKRINKTEDKKEKEDLEQKLKMIIEKQK